MPLSENNKFMLMLMGQEEFVEEFKKFSEEEQNEFIDFYARMVAFAISMLKEAPQELRVQAVSEGFAFLPVETRTELAKAMKELSEYGHI